MIVLLFVFLSAILSAGDISVVAGGGAVKAEDESSRGTAVVGASAGWPYASRHRLQADYLYSSLSGTAARQHFLTGSYIVQGKQRRVRPFFQVGAGISVFDYAPFFVGSRTFDIDSATGFAVVLGGGATVDIGERFFVKPQVRLYADEGLSASVLPMIGFGWRF